MNESPMEEFGRRYVRPSKGLTLIVGSKMYAGRENRKLVYDDAIGIDMEGGVGVDMVGDLCDAIALQKLMMRGPFAHVECWSVLEHARKPWVMADHIERLLMRSGTLHVIAPFVWRPHQYPGDYWRFTTDGIRQLFPRIAWVALKYADDALRDGRSGATKTNDANVPSFLRAEVFGFGIRI